MSALASVGNEWLRSWRRVTAPGLDFARWWRDELLAAASSWFPQWQHRELVESSTWLRCSAEGEVVNPQAARPGNDGPTSDATADSAESAIPVAATLLLPPSWGLKRLVTIPVKAVRQFDALIAFQWTHWFPLPRESVMFSWRDVAVSDAVLQRELVIVDRERLEPVLAQCIEQGFQVQSVFVSRSAVETESSTSDLRENIDSANVLAPPPPPLGIGLRIARWWPVALLAIVLLWAVNAWAAQSSERVTLEEALRMAHPRAEKIRAAQRLYDSDARLLAALATDAARPTVSQALEAVSGALPSDYWIESATWMGDRLSFRSQLRVDQDWQSWFKDSPVFVSGQALLSDAAKAGAAFGAPVDVLLTTRAVYRGESAP